MASESDDPWEVKACRDIMQTGYSRIRLRPEEVQLVSGLYDRAQRFFADSGARRALDIPDDQIDDLDSRSGYVDDRKREWFELHHFSQESFGEVRSPAAAQMLQSSWAFSNMCRLRCEKAIRHMSMSAPALATLLAGGDDSAAKAASPPSAPYSAKADPDISDATGGDQGGGALPMIHPMLRVYRYFGGFERDGDPHYDMGLLTLIPKSSLPGLQVRPEGSSTWQPIDKEMREDEAVLFCGMTLARLTGMQALYHRILTNGHIRYSAPYFQRLATDTHIPPTPGHEGETVAEYSRRLRRARNHELRSDGSIEWDPPSPSPSPRASSPPGYSPSPQRRTDYARPSDRSDRRHSDRSGVDYGRRSHTDRRTSHEHSYADRRPSTDRNGHTDRPSSCSDRPSYPDRRPSSHFDDRRGPRNDGDRYGGSRSERHSSSSDCGWRCADWRDKGGRYGGRDGYERGGNSGRYERGNDDRHERSSGDRFNHDAYERGHDRRCDRDGDRGTAGRSLGRSETGSRSDQHSEYQSDRYKSSSSGRSTGRYSDGRSDRSDRVSDHTY